MANNLVESMSVFLPSYNEEENIKNTVEQVLNALQELKIKNYEVLVINDGSKDKTAEVAKILAEKDPHVRLINHEVNRGFGDALKTGYESAKYDWVVYTDADGQFDFSEITKFIEKADKADVIVGYRLERADPFIRTVLTYGWKTIARILLGLSVKDYSTGFKMMKKKVYEAVSPLESGEKVTQIELLVKAKRKGFKFAEVGVHHYPRKFGTPTGANLMVFLKSLRDLVALWWQLK